MSLDWLLIRGSGLVAFALLGSSTIWGLLISGKLLGRTVKAKGLTWLHESLGVAALLATIVHMVALSVHDFLPFSWSEILIPGRATWRPVAVSLGTIAFYVLVIVSLSFYVKKYIGQTAWRAIHHLSFGLFVASLAHGIAAGTDTAHPAVVGLYTGFGTVVTVLLAIRFAQGREPERAERARPAPARQEREAIS